MMRLGSVKAAQLDRRKQSAHGRDCPGVKTAACYAPHCKSRRRDNQLPYRLRRLPACARASRATATGSLHQRELQQQRALDHREIVVGDHGQHGVAIRRDMGVDALHVVDFVAEIGIEDRRARRPPRRARARQARCAGCGCRRRRASENFRSSTSRSPERSSTASLTSKLSVRRTRIVRASGRRSGMPIRLPSASRPRSEIAISVPASGRPLGTITSASSPLLYGSLLRRRRQRHHLAARAGEALAEIETQHLVDALEADIDERAIERDRLRIEPAARGDRPAVGPQHRRGLDVVEPDHLAAAIDDAAGEPAALVADGDEALALGVEPQARQPAEAAKRRGQHQPAAIFKLAEPHTLSGRGCRTTAAAGH